MTLFGSDGIVAAAAGAGAGVGLVVKISEWILVGAGSLVDPLPTDWGPAWEFFVAGSAELLLSTTGAGAGAGAAGALAGAEWAGGGAADALTTGCCCTE